MQGVEREIVQDAVRHHREASAGQEPRDRPHQTLEELPGESADVGRPRILHGGAERGDILRQAHAVERDDVERVAGDDEGVQSRPVHVVLEQHLVGAELALDLRGSQRRHRHQRRELGPEPPDGVLQLAHRDAPAPGVRAGRARALCPAGRLGNLELRQG